MFQESGPHNTQEYERSSLFDTTFFKPYNQKFKKQNGHKTGRNAVKAAWSQEKKIEDEDKIISEIIYKW